MHTQNVPGAVGVTELAIPTPATTLGAATVNPVMVPAAQEDVEAINVIVSLVSSAVPVTCVRENNARNGSKRVRNAVHS